MIIINKKYFFQRNFYKNIKTTKSGSESHPFLLTINAPRQRKQFNAYQHTKL